MKRFVFACALACGLALAGGVAAQAASDSMAPHGTAMGHDTMGNTAMGHDSMGHPATAPSAMAHDSMGNSAMGHDSMGHPTASGPK